MIGRWNRNADFDLLLFVVGIAATKNRQQRCENRSDKSSASIHGRAL
jgi:hypothetical protein